MLQIYMHSVSSLGIIKNRHGNLKPFMYCLTVKLYTVFYLFEAIK